MFCLSRLFIAKGVTSRPLRVEVRPTNPDLTPPFRLVNQHLEHGRSLAELAAENGISLCCATAGWPAIAQAVQPLWRIDAACAAPSGGRSIHSRCSAPCARRHENWSTPGVVRLSPSVPPPTGGASLEPMAVESAVQTPQDVEAIQRLSALGWGRRRIARELGFSPETVRRCLRQGGRQLQADFGQCVRRDPLYRSRRCESEWSWSCGSSLLRCLQGRTPLEGRMGPVDEVERSSWVLHCQRQRSARIWASGAVVNS